MMRWPCWFGGHRWKDYWEDRVGTWRVRGKRCARCGLVRFEPSVLDAARRIR